MLVSGVRNLSIVLNYVNDERKKKRFVGCMPACLAERVKVEKVEKGRRKEVEKVVLCGGHRWCSLIDTFLISNSHTEE